MPNEREKRELLEKFSSEPEKYYEVELFREQGFVRKRCRICGRGFWTLDPSAELCPEHRGEGFVGERLTSRAFGYVDAWRNVEEFFVSEGHTSVPRYPVVARWRPDLYFTVASIIDFQRVEGGKVVFEFPANPLVVPQASLRFNDVENVGFTGRHYTEFVMIGQHALNDGRGYWKDRTIELDFRLLTERFGVPREEVVFVEDVWLGYGAFGYSLEYYVRGLELGNAVFTEFEGTPSSYRRFEPQVVDMGAGLERFVWLSQATPTSYDAVFSRELEELRRRLGLRLDPELSRRFFAASGRRDLTEVADPSGALGEVLSEAGIGEEEFREFVKPWVDLYAVLDHSRALMFAVADGALPSNVGGGYNLRAILRRAQGIIESNSWDIGIADAAELVAESLRPMFPELLESMPALREVLEVELQRYRATKARIGSIVDGIRRSGRQLTTDDVIRLYESNGVTPEMLVEAGVLRSVPADFYSRLASRHSAQPREEGKGGGAGPAVDVEGLPPTREIYYEDVRLTRCTSRVLRSYPEVGAVILEGTVFYPRGGGQEPDRGTLGGFRVRDVVKVGKVIVHFLEGGVPREGEIVECEIDAARRRSLMRHHTATHVVNGAARRVLGPWVWQHSAFKDEDGARLDVTHHSALTREQVEAIERLANEIVQQDLPVDVQVMPRGRAESLYGFRLYQGGAVPERELRVVKVGDFDVEACGGTHVMRTGEIGCIRILRSERIQDGVVRLEFVAGMRAVEHSMGQARALSELAGRLGAPPEGALRKLEELLGELEARESERRRLSGAVASYVVASGPRGTLGGLPVYAAELEGVSQRTLVEVGDAVARAVPQSVYVGISALRDEGRTALVVISHSDRVDAGELAARALRALGGRGGGRGKIGQGAVPRAVGIGEALAALGVEAGAGEPR
nr:alanyl-tRNA synthetase [uncultured archaeon]